MAWQPVAGPLGSSSGTTYIESAEGRNKRDPSNALRDRDFCGLSLDLGVIGGPVSHKKLMDETYEGSYRGGRNKALVRVAIKDNRIESILRPLTNKPFYFRLKLNKLTKILSLLKYKIILRYLWNQQTTD